MKFIPFAIILAFRSISIPITQTHTLSGMCTAEELRGMKSWENHQMWNVWRRWLTRSWDECVNFGFAGSKLSNVILVKINLLTLLNMSKIVSTADFRTNIAWRTPAEKKTYKFHRQQKSPSSEATVRLGNWDFVWKKVFPFLRVFYFSCSNM